MQIKVVLTFVAFGILSGCFPPTTTWTNRALSPDGRYVVLASTTDYTGPGTDAVITDVVLAQADGSRPCDLLEFDNGPSTPAGMNVDIKWDSPTHITLSIIGSDVSFQAIRCKDIDVSLRKRFMTDPHQHGER